MNNLQKAFFSLRRFRSTFNHMYLKNVKRSSLFHEISFKATSNGSCTCLSIQKSTQQVKHFSSLETKHEMLEKTEKVPVGSYKSFSEIDLSSKDLIQTFEHILTHYRISKSALSSEDFNNDLKNFVLSEEFINYCNALDQKLPYLSHHDLKVLLRLHLFRIPPSSPLFQKLLYLVIEKINDFTTEETAYILKVLHHSTICENPKVKILQMICSQYLETQISSGNIEQKDYEKIALFCNSKTLPLYIRKMILGVIGRNFKAIKNTLSITSLCHIVGSFSDTSLLPFFKPSMMEAVKERQIENFSSGNLHDLLSGCRQLYFNRRFSDHEYLEEIIQNLNFIKYNIFSLLHFADSFFCLDLNCFPIVQHIEKIFIETDLQSMKLFNLFRMSRALGNIYYHPFGYTGDDDVHKECLKKLDSYNYEMGSFKHFTKWCVFMTILGSSKKTEYINRLYKYLSETFTRESEDLLPENCESILMLQAFVKTHFPTEVNEFPEEIFRECVINLRKPNLVPRLRKILQTLLPSKAQIFEDCTSSLLHYIDIAVLLDENGQSKPEKETLNSSIKITRIEDINRSLNSDLILFHIYAGNRPCKFRNSSTLPSVFQLYQDSLKPLNCHVVFLDLFSINIMSNTGLSMYVAEKIDKFLKQDSVV